MHVEQSVDIDRPLPEVFNYVSDVANYPEWMAHVLEVRTESAGPPRQSDGFTVAIKSAGRRFETPYERTTYEAHRSYTDRAVGGPVPEQRWHCSFEEKPGGTRLIRSVNAMPGGLLKLLEPLQKRAAGRQLEQDLRALKSLLEQPR